MISKDLKFEFDHLFIHYFILSLYKCIQPSNKKASNNNDNGNSSSNNNFEQTKKSSR